MTTTATMTGLAGSSTAATIATLIRDTLALPDDAAVAPSDLLFHDLGLTSLDFLDLLFRIEEFFNISIPEGTIYGLARGDLDDAAFCENSVLTPRGREQLMALLFDTPEAVFAEKIHAQTLQRYCTVAALARLVDHKLGRGQEAG